VSGQGFGIPVVLRYVLEVAETTAEAVALLQRLPISMCYSITLLDRHADAATVFVAPDRPAEVTRRNAVTNFQHQVDWPEHARATHAEERLQALQQQLDGPGTLTDATAALLQPPLFQAAYLRGYGTLYSAVYRPLSGQVELLWPGQQWLQNVDQFAPGQRDIVYTPQAAEDVGPSPVELADALQQAPAV
jgi:predicted choloylglycine hydrolase